MDVLPIEVWAALAGLFGGGILGLAARLGEFCTLGALESAVYGQDQKRLRMWGIALGVAILGTFTLAEFGQVQISETIYHAIKWNPAASIVGGLLFGYGMAYAGNCGFGALARIGGGDLRALVVVIVLAIFSLMTLGGPLAGLRVMLFPEDPSEGYQGIAHLLAGLTSLSPLLFAAVIAFMLILWALMHEGLRNTRASMFWAVMVGVAITGSWWATSFLADYSLDAVAVQGLSYTAPVGRSLIYVMTSTAGGLNFAVGSISGVIVGGFIGSMLKGHFRWEACDDPQELGRQMMGRP